MLGFPSENSTVSDTNTSNFSFKLQLLVMFLISVLWGTRLYTKGMSWEIWRNAEPFSEMVF